MHIFKTVNVQTPGPGFSNPGGKAESRTRKVRPIVFFYFFLFRYTGFPKPRRPNSGGSGRNLSNFKSTILGGAVTEDTAVVTKSGTSLFSENISMALKSLHMVSSFQKNVLKTLPITILMESSI
jgi:hypothetical protein